MAMQHPTFDNIIERSSFIAYAKIDKDVIQTGNTKHFILDSVENDSDLMQIIEGKKPHPEGSKVSGIAGLIIMKEDSEDAYYLFGCNSDWTTLTDTWHETLEKAKDQAEFEFKGINKKWIIKKNIGNLIF